MSDPLLRFNNKIVSQTPYQEHFGIFFDIVSTLLEHLKLIAAKLNKTIGLMTKLPNRLSGWY